MGITDFNSTETEGMIRAMDGEDIPKYLMLAHMKTNINFRYSRFATK